MKTQFITAQNEIKEIKELIGSLKSDNPVFSTVMYETD